MPRTSRPAFMSDMNKSDRHDITKRRWYVLMELGGRLLSAVALALLGFAGWSLQERTASKAHEQEAHDRLVRQYLPMYQSLAVLQLGLSSTSDSTVTREYNNSENSTASRAFRVEYLAHSLYIPRQVSQTRADLVTLTGAEDYGPIGRPARTFNLPLRDAVLVYADLLRFIPEIVAENAEGKAKWVTFERPTALYFHIRRGAALPGDLILSVNGKASDAWARWFPSDGMSVADLAEINPEQFAMELVRGAGEVAHSSLSDNPDLAEKFVAIRTEVVKQAEE